MKKFVNRKSELTEAKEAFQAEGLEVFRTRLHCNCKPEQNRRYGILAVDSSDMIVCRVIRCKGCTKTALN